MRARPYVSAFALAVALAVAPPAGAELKEWHQYYDEAREHVAGKRPAEAIASLEAALRLKPRSELNARPYGVFFVDYVPYYYKGVAHLQQKDYAGALRAFEQEEKNGAIKGKAALLRELQRLKAEAEGELRAQENRLLAQRARGEARRLLREALDLERASKLDEALARLAGAQAAARDLDPQLQQQIEDASRRIRNERTTREDAAATARRLEAALNEGQRLLEQGQAAEAIVRFDEVLATERGNARALQGKRDAQERIRASGNRQALDAAFREGKAHFEAARYEQARLRLTVAAADPANAQARELLERARAILEGTRRQREERLKIESLMSEAEQLMASRKFAEAQVRFERVLELDPEHVQARERWARAERMTGEMIFEKWFPNQGPSLIFYQPFFALREGITVAEVDEPTLPVHGYASDDRGIAKLAFLVGDRVVAEQVPAAVPRNEEFKRQFPLEKGNNEIRVVATDTMGVEREATFRINRRLRFYETRAFLPSALAAALGLVGTGLGIQRIRRSRAIRRRFNPYIAGAPVLEDDMFFGRQKLMARILNVLHHNSLMITGERRIGKTTFLYHLKKALEVDTGTEYKFFPVFTDLQGVPESAFFHTVVADAVDALRLSPATLSGLRFKPELDKYDGRDFSHDLQRVIEELKTRTDRRVKLALLIDEVDVLNEYSERVNQRLRSIFMKTFSEHLVAIMSGVGVKRTWKSEGSPWYNFFDEVELKAFSREEAEALIRRPVEGIFRFDQDAVEAIVTHSEMKPFFVQKFCIHAINLMLEEGRSAVRLADVEAVREAVLSEAREEAPSPVRQPVSA
jgi:tetratricopeptide (TPR) repeat protein